MPRAAWLLALVAGCASVKATHVDEPDADVGDLAGAGSDLAGGGNDLAGADLKIIDLSAAGDLTPPGCGLGQVVVNEVQTSGSGGATDEWIELYNPCATMVNLAGSKLTYRSATNATLNDTYTLAALNLNIAANGYVLVANSG